jgi:hypothetical protein
VFDVGIINVVLLDLFVLFALRECWRICNPIPRPCAICSPPPRPCVIGPRPYIIGDWCCVFALTFEVLFFIGVPGNVELVLPNLKGEIDRFVVVLISVCFWLLGFILDLPV